MARRPLLDLEAPYFAESYSSEIIALELQYSLFREVINAQIVEEKRTIQQLYKTASGRKVWPPSDVQMVLSRTESRFRCRQVEVLIVPH